MSTGFVIIERVRMSLFQFRARKTKMDTKRAPKLAPPEDEIRGIIEMALQALQYSTPLNELWKVSEIKPFYSNRSGYRFGVIKKN